MLISNSPLLMNYSGDHKIIQMCPRAHDGLAEAPKKKMNPHILARDSFEKNKFTVFCCILVVPGKVLFCVQEMEYFHDPCSRRTTLVWCFDGGRTQHKNCTDL